MKNTSSFESFGTRLWSAECRLQIADGTTETSSVPERVVPTPYTDNTLHADQCFPEVQDLVATIANAADSASGTIIRWFKQGGDVERWLRLLVYTGLLPIVVRYRPTKLRHPSQMLKLWREWALANRHGQIAIYNNCESTNQTWM